LAGILEMSTIDSVERPRFLPNPDRLSIIAATILLAYASTNFINLPSRTLGLQLPSFYLAVNINVRTVITLIVAGLTATGADWLLNDHPALQGKRTFQHWLLPALTALVIGIPLYLLPFSTQWLVAFALGGALLMLVLVAEYIAVDPEDTRYSIASAGLTAVSFAIFLVLAIALRSAGIRLFLTLPALTLASLLVVLRTLNLRLGGLWAIMLSLALALIIAQIAAGLNYMPLSPTKYGLALIGPAYALTTFVGNLVEGIPFRRAIIGPVLVLMIVWGAALWIP
jgi:hypothetical protein